MSADLPRQDFNYLVNAVLEVVRSGLGTENKPAVFRGDFNFVAVVPFQSVNHGHFAVLGEEFVKFFEQVLSRLNGGRRGTASPLSAPLL